MASQSNTPPYAKLLIKLVRPFPNFDFSFIRPLRKKAAILLQLKPGNRVLDVGCGIGGSFPFIHHFVGDSGEVVGVEISADVIINTRKRIARNGWKNITVIESSAQDVVLSGKFDGLLMFATPDVYASPKAISNIFDHLKENSRVVLFGAKTSNNRLGKVFNLLFEKAIPKLSFDTTPVPIDRPWHLLENHLTDIKVNEYFFGLMFLASGTVTAHSFESISVKFKIRRKII